jgi:LPS export ABC transporter protein LptC
MAVNARNLLLFALLAGAALMTWVLAHVAQEPAAPAADTGAAPQGYYLTDAVLQGTDDEGRLYYRVFARRVEQEADGEDFVLDQMRVEYTPEIDVRWDFFAMRGLVDADRDHMQLLEGVRVTYLPDGDQDELTFETSELNLYTQDFFAATDQPVTLHKGSSEFKATGLKLDLETDDWELSSNVSMRINR